MKWYQSKFDRWMLTRAKHKCGEGKLESYNPDIGSRSFTLREEMDSPRKIGPFESEDDFFNAFNQMKQMVEELYSERALWKGECFGQVKKEDDIPPSPPPSRTPSSPTSTGPYPSTSHPSSLHKKIASRKPLLNLDVKFNMPMYNDEPNAEKIYNWIWKMEVYYRVQKIDEDEVKLQLASLHLEVTTLIWWEGIQKSGNILSSWLEFKFELRKQFYPLEY